MLRVKYIANVKWDKILNTFLPFGNKLTKKIRNKYFLWKNILTGNEFV